MASLVFRWGLTLLVALIAIAFAYRLQQPLFDSWPQSHEEGSKVHCYRGIRTHDDERPSAKCFNVADGLFQDVWDGDVDENEQKEEIEESDGYVIPGLWDGHGHLSMYAEFLHSVDLFGSGSLAQVRERLRDYLGAHPDAGSKDRWVRGTGWDQTNFGRMPTAADLEQDPILKGKYVMLDRIDVHCTWVSQPVLDLLPAAIPDIPGGEIIREPGMGVFCDNAMDLITALWPRPSPEEKAETVKAAIKELNKVGLVGMHDAGNTPETLRLYESMAGGEDWTLRVYAMLECEKRNTLCPDDRVWIERDDGMLTVRSVKLFGDGALGSWGSAMLEPYSDHPWTSGSLLINATDLTSVTKSWAAAGYQVNIHAIGDLANRNALDAFEAALAQQCSPRGQAFSIEDAAACQESLRFRIEHAQIIHPDDQVRLLQLGILPSIQPTHATSDMKYALDRLGADRVDKYAYRMRSLLAAHPVLGSDFPVEPPDPFQGIFAAVARKSPHTGDAADGDEEGWHADEALSLDEALRGFTLGPAYGGFMEGRAGVIKKGAFADWVVLDNNVVEMNIEEFRSVKVRETWVAGKRVYKRDD